VSDTFTGRLQTDEDVLTVDVSDETLEIAACPKSVGAFTLAACTGLSACPA
jgi:hypothetical protein